MSTNPLFAPLGKTRFALQAQDGHGPAMGEGRAFTAKPNTQTHSLIMNKPTNHTPGPWHLRGDTVLVKPSLQVCQLDRGNKHPDTTRANAHLIAAAPDLLEACQELLEAFAPHCQDTIAKFGPDALHSGVKRALAAIAKATNQQEGL